MLLAACRGCRGNRVGTAQPLPGFPRDDRRPLMTASHSGRLLPDHRRAGQSHRLHQLDRPASYQQSRKEPRELQVAETRRSRGRNRTPGRQDASHRLVSSIRNVEKVTVQHEAAARHLQSPGPGPACRIRLAAAAREHGEASTSAAGSLSWHCPALYTVLGT